MSCMTILAYLMPLLFTTKFLFGSIYYDLNFLGEGWTAWRIY